MDFLETIKEEELERQQQELERQQQELERQQQVLREEEKMRLQEEQRKAELLKTKIKEEERQMNAFHALSAKLNAFQNKSYSAPPSARQPIQIGTRPAKMDAERAKLEELQHLLQEATENSAIDREQFLKKEQALASQIQTLKEEHAAALTSQQSEHAAALTSQQEALTQQRKALTRKQKEYAAALTRQREEHSGVLTRQQSEHAAALTRQQSEHAAALTRQQEDLTLKQEALIRQQEALTRQRKATRRQRMMREQEEQARREKEKLLRNKTNFEKTLANIGPAVLARKLDEQAAKIDKTKAKLATTKGALKEQGDKLAETKGALINVSERQQEQLASIKQIQEAQNRTRGELTRKTGRLRTAAAIAALATGAAMTRHATTPNGGPLGIVERHSRRVPYNTSFYGDIDGTHFPAGNSSFYGDTTSVPMGERKSNFSALYTGDTDFSTHVPFTSDYSVPTTETTDYSVPTTETTDYSVPTTETTDYSVPTTEYSAHVPWQQRLQSLDPSHYRPAPDIPEQSKEDISVPSSQGAVATGISVPSSQEVATGISVPSEAKAAEAKTYEQLYIPPSKYTFFTDFDYDNPSEYILVKGHGDRRAEFFKISDQPLPGKIGYVSIRDKMHSVNIDKKDKTRILSTASITEQEIWLGFISGQGREWPITKKSDIVSVNPTFIYKGEKFTVTSMVPDEVRYQSDSAKIILQNYGRETVARYKKNSDTIYTVINDRVLEPSGGSRRRRTRRNKRTRRRRTRSV